MNSLALGVIPEQLTPLTILHLVNTIDQLHVCPGNPDDKFVDMVTSKKGVIKSVVNTAWILPAAPVICNGKLFWSTVRRCDCRYSQWISGVLPVKHTGTHLEKCVNVQVIILHLL